MKKQEHVILWTLSFAAALATIALLGFASKKPQRQPDIIEHLSSPPGTSLNKGRDPNTGQEWETQAGPVEEAP